MRTIHALRAAPALLPLAFGCAFLPPALAQTTLAPTVVTATRMESRADALVSDVVVIDRATVQASAGRSLAELLARHAGLQFAANGGRGKQSSVFIRGTESRHAILLVDGVRMGSATSGNPNWDTLPLEMIERIEVLRGPASALYGSDAVGGVVQVFTRRGREGFHPQASLTLGSERHRLATASAAGGQGPLRYSFGVQRLRERGFSATNPRVPFNNYNPDVDPFEQDALHASMDYALAPGWRVDAGLLASQGSSWYDEGPGRDARSDIRALAAHAGATGRLSPNWRSTLRVHRSDDVSDAVVAASPGLFRTQQTEWAWQNDVDTPLGVVLAGLERREQQVSGTTAYAVRERAIDAAFVGVNGSAGAHSWQANLRRDHNSQFGGATTGFVGYGLRLAPAWRVSASHGTSFVAPSFNQLYFPGFGNPALQPERGRNSEVALAWTGQGQELKLVRFVQRIRGFQTNTTLPQNIPRARIDGWSLGWDGRWGALDLNGTLDLLDPRNEANDRLLPRRARRQASLAADWTQGPWRYGASLLAVDNRFDDAANRRPLAGYATLDLHADWRFAPEWSVQARLNNVADRAYETAYGYEQPGRAFYLTLRWQPRP